MVSIQFSIIWNVVMNYRSYIILVTHQRWIVSLIQMRKLKSELEDEQERRSLMERYTRSPRGTPVTNGPADQLVTDTVGQSVMSFQIASVDFPLPENVDTFLNKKISNSC